ncbi:hypothetical protein WJX82_007440 [Trebouxia sp. C0006]
MTLKVVATPVRTTADLECRDSAGCTRLMQASTAGSAADVRDLLTRGADIHATSPQTSQTALHYAVMSNQRKAVSALLSGGANPSAVNCQGFTPLMQATCNGNLKIMKLLLAAGADATATNVHGLTALQLMGTYTTATDLEARRCLQAAAQKAKASTSFTSGGTMGRSGAALAGVNGANLAAKPIQVSMASKGEASKKAKEGSSKNPTSKPLSKAAAPAKANKASASTSKHHEAALFDDQLTKARGQQLLHKLQDTYNVQCSLQLADSGLHTSSSVTVNGVKLQVVAGDLLQQDVEAIASALGRAPIGVGNTPQTAPIGPFHALASWFGAAFGQTSNDLGVSRPTQRPQQHHLLAVGPPYTGREQSDVAALRTVVQSVLADAAALHVKSLALPLIGAGKAQWPAALAAKTQVAAICAAASQGRCGQLQEVRLVDLSVVAVQALKQELSGYKAKAYISFVGDESDCNAAVLHYEQVLKASITSTEVKLCAAFSTQSLQRLLAAASLMAVSVWFTHNNTLMLKGIEELVCRAEAHVLRVLYEALHQASTANSLTSQYPDTWSPQSTANTELFEVNLNSLEARPLVQALQAAGATVVKVHRIQNKKLWNAFGHSQACMKERWSHEPSLPLINGGHPTLWHGTSHTEPYKIYGAELGFTQNFASLTGAWGVGTYYATKPRLALHFGYTLQAGDLAFSTSLAGFSYSQRQGLKQVLAVDVLTGKSKHLGQDRSLRMPPKLEDARVGQRLGIPDLRYDSVSGTYTSCQTPIYITYNSAHGYPKYLITYR